MAGWLLLVVLVIGNISLVVLTNVCVEAALDATVDAVLTKGL